MNRGRVRLAAVAGLGAALLVGSLVAAPIAGAAITSSSITTPADPAFLSSTVDPNTGHATGTFAISGTTSGGTPATDKVDILCYYGTSHTVVASGVSLASDGSFSVPAASMDAIYFSSGICRLRAVPAGTAPADLTPFAGPQVTVTGNTAYSVIGGPNAGHLYDYYLYAQQLTGAFDYDSISSCGVDDGYLFDSTLAYTTTTFYCNAALFRSVASGSPRSELQIDGANAYPTWAAQFINNAATGLPALTQTYTVDPATGNLVIHESEPLVKCPDPTYPPTTVTCPSFVSTGVTDDRTITQDHDGHVSWVTDDFTSTDGKGHTVDLLWDNNQRFHGSSGDSTMLEYEFPGQTSYSTHAQGDSVSLPASSPGTILVRMHGAADGDMSTGQGAIVYDRPATAATFTATNSTFETFTLHQTGSVPAGGSTRFRFAFVHDYQSANVASMAQTASTAFLNTITVTRSGKGKGTVTSSPGGISCGKTCSHGYPYGTSVTLQPKAAKGSLFSRWSGACTGSGSCTVTTNDDAAVSAKFALRPCVVPNVKGKSLKSAKRAIKKAYCSVGKITMVASTTVKKGHVISQKPKAHKRLKQHGKVRLVVSKG